MLILGRMIWSAAPDRDSLPAARRAESYLAALVRMGYLRAGRSEKGRARIDLTGPGRRLLARIVSGATASRRCRICGGPTDKETLGKLESRMEELEGNYDVEISMTLCCIECLDWPDYVLRRAGTLLRSWQSGGRPRSATVETWQVGEMEVSGFLDARSRRVELVLEAAPKIGNSPVAIVAEGEDRPDPAGDGAHTEARNEKRDAVGEKDEAGRPVATSSSACRTG